jgi:hypothetical protein
LNADKRELTRRKAENVVKLGIPQIGNLTGQIHNQQRKSLQQLVVDWLIKSLKQLIEVSKKKQCSSSSSQIFGNFLKFLGKLVMRTIKSQNNG